MAPNKDIEKFLLECDLYNSDVCRWRDIPENHLHESELHNPIADILEAVISHFYPSFDSNPPTRIVLDSHATQLHYLAYRLCAMPLEIKRIKKSIFEANLVQIVVKTASKQ